MISSTPLGDASSSRFALALTSLAWAACTSFGGDATPNASNGGDAELRDAAKDALPDTDVGIRDGGGPALDAHVAIDGALLDESFEFSGSCGWAVNTGVTAFPVAGGKSGARSCLICSTASGGTVQKVVPVDAGGIFELIVFGRAPPQDASARISTTIYAYFADGGLSSVGTGSQLTSTGQWVLTQAVAEGNGVPNSVGLYIGTGDTGGCVMVDDISLTRN